MVNDGAFCIYGGRLVLGFFLVFLSLFSSWWSGAGGFPFPMRVYVTG